jgi:hypothetical protein
VTVAVLVCTRSAISRYGKPLVEQADDLPPVDERLQLAERAEVAQEAPELVAVPRGEKGVGEVVETGDLLDLMSSCLGWSRAHISMLAC